MKTLVPCINCGRHVRTSDTSCPFCGHTVESDASARAVGRTHGARLTRAALFAFGATAAACSPASDNTDAQVQDSATDAGTMALYGGPPVFVGVRATGSRDDAGTMALYGGPPVDSGAPTDAGTGNDASDGSPGARYGAPPVDAA
jgi:hypothetical protein